MKGVLIWRRAAQQRETHTKREGGGGGGLASRTSTNTRSADAYVGNCEERSRRAPRRAVVSVGTW